MDYLSMTSGLLPTSHMRNERQLAVVSCPAMKNVMTSSIRSSSVSEESISDTDQCTGSVKILEIYCNISN